MCECARRGRGPWRQEGVGPTCLCHRSHSALPRLPAVSSPLPSAALGARCVAPTPERRRRLVSPMRVPVPACRWCWFQSSVVRAQFQGPGSCRDESPTEPLKIFFTTAHCRKTETRVNSNFPMHQNHLIETPPARGAVTPESVRVSDSRAPERGPEKARFSHASR